ncbi:MAG: hypothetical protein JSR59_22780 [Proteobacteria bacterium]|nr:hypothetical protein [Pseudomonadota bacterium]
MTAADPTRRMAQLQVGDWWAYDGHGTAERGGQRVALQGTVRVEVERRESAGAPRAALVFAPQWRIAGVDGPAGVFPMPAGLFYFVQDAATGDLSIAGDNMGPGGSDRFAAAPQVFYPGRFDAETAYDNVLDFGPLGTVANSLRVVGIETVVTALGEFAAWRAPIASISAQFGRVEGVDHWRPVLGAPVRFEMTATAPDGSRLATVAVLRATNRALE